MKQQIQILILVTSNNATWAIIFSFNQLSFPLSLLCQPTDLNSVAKSPKQWEDILFLERYYRNVGPLNMLASTYNPARAFWSSRKKKHKGKWRDEGEENLKKLLKNQPTMQIYYFHMTRTLQQGWVYMYDTFGFRSGPTTFLCQTASRSKK